MIAGANGELPGGVASCAGNGLGHVHSTLNYLQKVLIDAQKPVERCHAIFLDRDRRYLADISIGTGNFCRLSLRMRELFGKALGVGAAGIIVAHNHPSGICRPSRKDIEETHRLADVGRALDIELIDHLIFTERAAYSMRAGGKL